MADLVVKQGEYLGSFRLLIDDLKEVCAFVQPADANLNTFSHRIYELFLRACTEFESASKQALVSKGNSKPVGEMNINDYRTLEQHLKLEQFEVGLLFWQPAPSYVKPFASWSTAQPPLSWYSDYNKVKHNRNTEFSVANLGNLRLAISGLFALLAQLHVFSDENDWDVITDIDRTNVRETIFFGYPFILRCPPSITPFAPRGTVQLG